MWEFGISRLADVTGLDIIGMPVYMAVRPASRSLSVSQGKGLDRAAAKASALMESVEGWHAERVNLPIVYESFRALRRSSSVVDIARLPRRRPGTDSSTPMPWVEGYDLVSRGPMWVPMECVSLNLVRPGHLGGVFTMSSNGLASGNHILEAAAHGLLEVVERDALALWRARGGLDGTGPLADLDAVADPGVLGLLHHLRDCGIAVALADATTDTATATFVCTLVEDSPMLPRWTLKGMFAGYGSHLDPNVAMARAITEAVQSRLTHIAGSRDDMFHYDTQANPDDVAGSSGFLNRDREPLAYADLSTDTFEGDLEVILGRLRTVGVTSAVVVDLSRDDIGVPVVKVVVPGLESNPDSADYAPGPRARAVSVSA